MLPKILRSKILLVSIAVLLAIILTPILFIAHKQGYFLTKKNLYSKLEIGEKERQNLDLDEPIRQFVQTTEKLLGESEKCNLQIEFPKRLENSEKDLSLKPSKQMTKIVAVSEERDLREKEILQTGEILQLDTPFGTSFYDQNLSITCADKQTMREILEMAEKDALRDRKQELKQIYHWDRIIRVLTAESEYQERVKTILKYRNPYKFYNLDQKQLAELTDWELSKYELKNIKIIEQIGFTPKAKIQLRTFNLFFEHGEKGYSINFAINKNLNSQELERAVADYIKERDFRPGDVENLKEKEKAIGLFANQINLKFKVKE